VIPTEAVAYWLGSRQPLKNSGGSLAAADTHGDHAITRLAALHLAQNCGGEFCSRASQWVAESDGAAIGVDALRVKAPFANHRQSLHGKGLVQLDGADRV